MSTLFIGGLVLQGTNTRLPMIWTNGKAGKWLFSGKSWNWSNIKFDGVKSSITFIPDSLGGKYGDKSIGTGSATSSYPNKVDPYDYTNIRYEIDSAGGTGSFQLISRELSYWHKISPIIYSCQYTEDNSTILFDDSGFSIVGATDCNNIIYENISNIDDTKKKLEVLNKLTLNTTDDTTNFSYMVIENNLYDITLNYKIGPNNSSVSAYTDVWLIGFKNENEEYEYFNTAYCSYQNVPWRDNGSYLNARVCKEDGHYYYMPAKNICLLQLWQQPDLKLKFYTHILFINPQYTDYDNFPSSDLILQWSYISWDTTETELLLYIEFGASADGGQNIYWNGTELDKSISDNSRQLLLDNDITTIVPNDIYKYITVLQTKYTCKPDSDRNELTKESVYSTYIDSSMVYGNNSFKYIRIKVKAIGPNSEENNLQSNITDTYSISTQYEVFTNTSATNKDDPKVDENNRYLSSYLAKYEDKSESCFKFHILKGISTMPWQSKFYIHLNYQKDSMKYIYQ